MASALSNPVEASIGAAFGGWIGTLSGAAWLGSETAKFGRYLAGAPGEVAAAAFGAGTGAAAGLAVGAGLGALSGRRMVSFVLGQRGPIALESALETAGSAGAAANDALLQPLEALTALGRPAE